TSAIGFPVDGLYTGPERVDRLASHRPPINSLTDSRVWLSGSVAAIGVSPWKAAGRYPNTESDSRSRGPEEGARPPQNGGLRPGGQLVGRHRARADPSRNVKSRAQPSRSGGPVPAGIRSGTPVASTRSRARRPETDGSLVPI